jgi:hypothetical protein
MDKRSMSRRAFWTVETVHGRPYLYGDSGPWFVHHRLPHKQYKRYRQRMRKAERAANRPRLLMRAVNWIKEVLRGH